VYSSLEITSQTRFDNFAYFRYFLRDGIDLVNSWPSPVGDGSTDVSIEYEIDAKVMELENVVITIPMPMYAPESIVLM
jgi:hypothetical protein